MAPTKYFTVATILLAALTAPTAGEPYLVGFPQDVTPRDEIVQGWALVENLCPDGTGTCGKRSCCPIGSYCDDNEATNSNLCCPTRTGCAYDVSKADRCAVSTWVEWFTVNDPICCLPGEIGVQPGPHDYYGFCSSAGSNIPSSLLASTVHSPSTAGATSQPTSSPSSAAIHPTPTASATTPPAAVSTPTGSASAPATKASTSSAAGAATSTAAANVNTSVQGGLSSLLGIIGVILGFLAV